MACRAVPVNVCHQFCLRTWPVLALLVVWPPVLVVYLLDDASSELATLLLSVTIGLIIVLQILGSFVAKCLPSSRRAVRSLSVLGLVGGALATGAVRAAKTWAVHAADVQSRAAIDASGSDSESDAEQQVTAVVKVKVGA